MPRGLESCIQSNCRSLVDMSGVWVMLDYFYVYTIMNLCLPVQEVSAVRLSLAALNKSFIHAIVNAPAISNTFRLEAPSLAKET